MRTTVRLDDDLVAEAKMFAVRQRRTLTSVIEEALRRLLQQSADSAEGGGDLPVSRRPGWVLPGVDLDDSAALHDVMDSAEDGKRDSAAP